ncbi:CocE/NonD family hydrolase [Rhizorhabdus argentea]|uniref:CocE/NonD family hydrolase n=1 Tax=Rhizorhabdus argentea TaxID=1387174 RepID=UPI0030EE1A99
MDATALDADRSTQPYKVRVESNLPVPMRDGVVLRADVYRPEGDGPWPVLLSRTPYNKSAVEQLLTLDPVRTAQRGFIVVMQDTRGRTDSDGEWMPFRHERDDGYDSVEWAARLPGANGRVGMFGGSYVGNTQWMAALAQPPSLGAISPMVTWCDPMDGLYGRGGAIEWGLELPWTLTMGFEHVMKLPVPIEERTQRGQTLLEDYEAMTSKSYWDLPVRGSATLKKHALPGLGAIRAIDDPDSIGWCRVAGQHEQVQVPSLHWGGWYDVFLQGTLDNYIAATAAGQDARLLVGPWTHGVFRDPIGDLCFGAMSSRLGAPVHPHGDTNDFQLAWFRQHLVPEAQVDLPGAPVRIFVMGKNIWRDEQEWPLQRARVQRHYLHADGSLTTAEPAGTEASTTFTYDPADPVPTLGGLLVMASAYRPGPLDQAQVEARDDVCVFTSAPLTEELEVTGRIRVVLHSVSSAPSTDWVARLCDVHPDGRSFNLSDGILRVTAGADEAGRHVIDLWSTSNLFLAGHRIRVHVTSSSFPRWDRNLNTGDQDSGAMQVAQQRIFHDTKRPSFIELPVVDSAGTASS